MKIQKPGLIEKLTTIGAESGNENRVLSCVLNSNKIFEMNHIKLIITNTKNPSYVKSHTEEIIFLPDRHFDLAIFNTLKDNFKSIEYQKVIIYHEFGHAAQTTCINNNQSVHIKETSSEGDINYLFHGSSVPNKINNFLVKLFQEGFADCYSGLCLYKETGNIDVFEKISIVRSQRYDELKKPNKHYIHPNFNIMAAKNMVNTVNAFISQGKDIFNLPFTNASQSIERYIERCVIAGCVQALITELKTNDAFLNHFRKFNKEFKIDDSLIINFLGNSPETNNIIKLEKEQGVSSFFFELQKRLPTDYKSILPTNTLKDFLTNDVFKRNVDQNLTLNNVVDITYTSGFEKSKLQIKSIRESFYSSNQNIKNSNFKLK